MLTDKWLQSILWPPALFSLKAVCVDRNGGRWECYLINPFVQKQFHHYYYWTPLLHVSSGTACVQLFITINSQGFIQKGGGAGIPPPPISHNFPYPEILKLSMVIILAILHVTERMCHQNVWKFCPRLHEKQSERYINSKFSLGGGMPPDPPSRHTCISHTTIICYHPVSPPNSKSCIKTW